MSDQSADRDILKAKLNQETAKASWKELQPFFARGQTVYVAPELDLIEVALAFSEDQADILALWRDKGQVDKVTDDQAAQWFETDQGLWTVVVMPWVLVQPMPVQ
jgi:hypothetical protein